MKKKTIKDFIASNVNNRQKSYHEIKKLIPGEFQAKKLGKVYSLHRYWTKQPINVIENFIKLFSEPEDIVLDPFCGVGTTGVAAKKHSRKALLLDISPVAVFLAKCYTQKLSDLEMKQLDQVYNDIIEDVREIMDNSSLYRTNCRECGDRAHIRDYIFSETYSCPNCNSEIVFCEGTWEKISERKRSKNVQCHNCREIFTRKKIGNRFIRYIPIALRYSCMKCYGNKKIFSNLSPEDIEILKTRNIQELSDFYPTDAINKGINTRQPLSRKINTVDKFFTENGIFALARIFAAINNVKSPLLRSKLTFIFTSIIFRTSKMYRLRVDGQGGVLSGTLYIPPVFQDINPLDVFIERYCKIRRGQEVLNEELSDSPVHAEINSALDLGSITDNSIDYIYTDPPYAGNINYSELNLLWEAWIGNRTEIKDEIIVNKYQNKGMEDYQIMLEKAVCECYRVLKNERVMTLVFHHTDPKAWGVLQRAIKSRNFVTLGFSKVYSRMMTAKQTESSVAAQGFLLCHFLKFTGPEHAKTELKEFDKMDVQRLIRNYFEQNVDSVLRSREKLYDYIIRELFDYCWIKPFTLESMIREAGISIKLKKK